MFKFEISLYLFKVSLNIQRVFRLEKQRGHSAVALGSIESPLNKQR